MSDAAKRDIAYEALTDLSNHMNNREALLEAPDILYAIDMLRDACADLFWRVRVMESENRDRTRAAESVLYGPPREGRTRVERYGRPLPEENPAPPQPYVTPENAVPRRVIYFDPEHGPDSPFPIITRVEDRTSFEPEDTPLHTPEGVEEIRERVARMFRQGRRGN